MQAEAGVQLEARDKVAPALRCLTHHTMALVAVADITEAEAVTQDAEEGGPAIRPGPSSTMRNVQATQETAGL